MDKKINLNIRANNLPLVSVVISCRNEEKFIANCLDSFINQEYPNKKMEILVVDGMSEDKTRGIVGEYSKKYPFIKMVDNPNKVTPYAFNLGITNSGGELIFFAGAHAKYDNQFVLKSVENLYEYKADVSGGILKTVSKKDTLVARAIALSLSSSFGAGNAAFRVGAEKPTWVDTVFGGCYRREIFDKVGLFNENLVRSQDMEFSQRLKKYGVKILLVPDIVAYYYPKDTLWGFLKHNLKDGIWAVYPLKFVKIPFKLRHYIPLIFVLTLPLSIWPYILASLYFSFKIAKREKDFRLFFVLPLVFFVRHFAYGIGSILGVVKLVIDSAAFKRLFDILASAVGLLLISPIFLAVSFLIKVSSAGPVFYISYRIGKKGKPFKIYKFRTMVVNADKIGGPSTAADDPRLTKIGLFLKKYQLDELPQLMNVFKGDMSFVGPRPEVKVYVDMMTAEEKDVILSVKPGITDFASLWNFHEGELLKGSKDPEKTYIEKIRPEKLRLQKKYVRERSFWVDLKIIFGTVLKVFK